KHRPPSNQASSSCCLLLVSSRCAHRGSWVPRPGRDAKGVRSSDDPAAYVMVGFMQPMKQRVDQLLVDRGLAESRTRAQALILAGKVFSRERRIDKPGVVLPDDVALDVRGQAHPWVSRGGLKLEHALRHFALSPAGRVCLDIGAST